MFLIVASQLKEYLNRGSPYPQEKELEFLILCFLRFGDIRVQISHYFLWTSTEASTWGVCGPWSWDLGRKHVLRFFPFFPRIFRARGKAISTILGLSLLNCQAPRQFLLPSPSPLLMISISGEKPSSLFGCHTFGTVPSLEILQSLLSFCDKH